METEGSLPNLRDPYPEPDQPSPWPPIPLPEEPS